MILSFSGRANAPPLGFLSEKNGGNRTAFRVDITKKCGYNIKLRIGANIPKPAAEAVKRLAGG